MKDSKPDSQFEDKEWTFVIEDVSHCIKLYVGPHLQLGQSVSVLRLYHTVSIKVQSCPCTLLLYQALYHVDYT